MKKCIRCGVLTPQKDIINCCDCTRFESQICSFFEKLYVVMGCILVALLGMMLVINIARWLS